MNIPGWIRRARRLSLSILAVLLVLAAAGALYQTVSVRRESGRFPPPGRLVDVGGRRLHLICIGEGRPTVIFESSGLGGALSSPAARTEIGAQTRVCSYDRMGLGWSDPGPATVSVGTLADDLERLLDGAGLRPPYILVPSSIGGLTVELFARRHPERVAGLVFLDAADSGALERIVPRLTATVRAEACLLPIAARLGIVRLLDPFGFRRERSDAANRSMARLYRVEPMATVCGIARGTATSLQELRAAPPFAADVPFAVLTAQTSAGLVPPGLDVDLAVLERERLEQQRSLSRRSSRGTWHVVPGSDHLIGNSQPHAVAAAVLEMLSQVRRSS